MEAARGTSILRYYLLPHLKTQHEVFNSMPCWLPRKKCASNRHEPSQCCSSRKIPSFRRGLQRAKVLKMKQKLLSGQKLIPGSSPRSAAFVLMFCPTGLGPTAHSGASAGKPSRAPGTEAAQGVTREQGSSLPMDGLPSCLTRGVRPGDDRNLLRLMT